MFISTSIHTDYRTLILLHFNSISQWTSLFWNRASYFPATKCIFAQGSPLVSHRCVTRSLTSLKELPCLEFRNTRKKGVAFAGLCLSSLDLSWQAVKTSKYKDPSRFFRNEFTFANFALLVLQVVELCATWQHDVSSRSLELIQVKVFQRMTSKQHTGKSRSLKCHDPGLNNTRGSM